VKKRQLRSVSGAVIVYKNTEGRLCWRDDRRVGRLCPENFSEEPWNKGAILETRGRESWQLRSCDACAWACSLALQRNSLEFHGVLESWNCLFTNRNFTISITL